jgi:hypothetical protein
MNFVNVHVTDNPTQYKLTKLFSANTVIMYKWIKLYR